MDNYCLFLTQELEKEIQTTTLPQQIKKEDVVFIPHNYTSEEKCFEEDMRLFCKAYPEVNEALKQGESITLDVSLQELNAVVPRKRVRCDAYYRFQRFLLTKGITLNLTSKKKNGKEKQN